MKRYEAFIALSTMVVFQMESRTRNAQVDFPRYEVLVFLSLSRLRDKIFGMLVVTDGCMKLQYHPAHATFLWVEYPKVLSWVAEHVEDNAILSP